MAFPESARDNASRDATVVGGVHIFFLRSELLVALYLVQKSNCETFESSPGFLSRCASDISRMKLETETLRPFFLYI